MTCDDGAVRIRYAARHEAGEKSFCAIFRVRGREGAGAMAVAWQVRDEHAQVLLGECSRQKGHDFLIGGEPGKEHDRPSRNSFLLFEDRRFQPAAGGGNEIRPLAIGFREREPEACGDKKDSSEGACGFS